MLIGGPILVGGLLWGIVNPYNNLWTVYYNRTVQCSISPKSYFNTLMRSLGSLYCTSYISLTHLTCFLFLLQKQMFLTHAFTFKLHLLALRIKSLFNWKPVKQLFVRNHTNQDLYLKPLFNFTFFAIKLKWITWFLNNIDENNYLVLGPVHFWSSLFTFFSND